MCKCARKLRCWLFRAYHVGAQLQCSSLAQSGTGFVCIFCSCRSNRIASSIYFERSASHVVALALQSVSCQRPRALCVQSASCRRAATPFRVALARGVQFTQGRLDGCFGICSVLLICIFGSSLSLSSLSLWLYYRQCFEAIMMLFVNMELLHIVSY